MKLYVTTLPFLKGYTGKDNEPDMFPVGTTFAAIGFDNMGLIMQPVDQINEDKKTDFRIMSLNPELIKLGFKEVQQVNSTLK